MSQPNLLELIPGVRDYIFDGHRGAGPSSSERWMNCTESLGMSRAFLETLAIEQQHRVARSSSAARQGTTAHAVAEVKANFMLGRATEAEMRATLMELSVDPDDESEALSSEMSDYVDEYLDLIQQYAHERGPASVQIEERLISPIPLTGGHAGETYEISGSGDCIVGPVAKHPDLVVIDLKYGDGLDVEVDENSQARIYALGALRSLYERLGAGGVQPGSVTYHIVQPRLGGVKTWSESVADLLAWRDDVLSPALTAALFGEGAKFAPSDATCQWCPARGSCPALIKQTMEQGESLFEAMLDDEVSGTGTFGEESLAVMESERLGSFLDQALRVRKITDDMKAEVQRRMLRGEPVPGFKLVGYTPPRRWSPVAEEKLRGDDELWVRKLVTPLQALKLMEVDGEAPARVVNAIEVLPRIPVVAADWDRRKQWTEELPELLFPDLDGDPL